jgi:PAS domain S-box-containing protein
MSDVKSASDAIDRAQLATRIAEDRFAYFVENVTDYAIYSLDPTGVISSWNAGAARFKGYSADEIIGRNFANFFTEEDRAAGKPQLALATAAREGKFESEGWRVRKDGSQFWASVVLDAIRDPNGELLGFTKITRDITERREAAIALEKAQAQLAQAQKMESVGHLTGGVAHDFNNLLAIILGSLERITRTLATPTPDLQRIAQSVEHAMEGARRAATLTQRLLAFSRQQPLTPKRVDANKLVAGMSDLLRRTLGEEIAIETVAAPELWPIFADPNNVELAILNLAVNARDAMPEGGRLTIETANIQFSRAGTEVAPGDYVAISVTDTGCGMPRDIVERAFEPFFTTKDVGHGTGLGLSQVYGFAKQSGGHVKIYSEPGEGTTVRLFFPRLDVRDDDAPEVIASAVLPRGNPSETILVVEDDDGVRANTREMLNELGYRTIEAGNGHAALVALRAHPEVRLLLSDVGLPGGMNGQQLAERAREMRPDLKIMFATGYTRKALMHDGRLDEGVQLLMKPFTYAALASKLRSVLDG